MSVPVSTFIALYTDLYFTMHDSLTKHCATTSGALAATRDKLQHLPKEQRQHAAADMALRIASMLGLDDSDGDEDPPLSQVS